MTDTRREHFLSDFGGIVKDPALADKVPLPCRNCRDGKLGVVEKGRATCKQCGRIHGLIVLLGKVNYGVLL